MSEQEYQPGFKTPRLTFVWTAFAVAAIAALAASTNWLNEEANIQPGVINIVKLVLCVLTGLAWSFWLLFFSGHRARYLIALLCLSLIVVFFYFFRLIVDGDLGFVRVESRFVVREFVPLAAASGETKSVELAITSDKDFDQFLGNQRNGVVRHRVLNANWQQHPPQIVWKQPIGEGWSGFSAVNGFAVTQEQRGQEECVTCYDLLTGELKWIQSIVGRHEDTMSLGKAGPRATPTIHEGKVYSQGATGVLQCLNGRDGSVIWSQDLTELLGTKLSDVTSTRGYQYQFENPKQSRLAWGRSGSPLIYQDTVIVPGGVQQDTSFATLIAFDKQSGDEKWRGGSKMIAYGSPSIETLLGRKQITLVAESSALGFDPEDGTVLWETARSGTSNADANCSQVTKLSDNRILLSKGYQLGGEVVELSAGEDGGVSLETVWKNPRVLKTKMMSPVILDGYAYSLSDGFLECSDVNNDENAGRRVWRKRGRFGNGQLLIVGKHLLVHTEQGVLKLVEATPEEYNELGEMKTIDGVCWNTICLYDDFLLVRSELEAACIQLTTEVQKAMHASRDIPSEREQQIHETQSSDSFNDYESGE